MRAWGMGFCFVSDNRDDIRIGTFVMEVVRQTRLDGLRKQVAEQQDSAPSEADLEESCAFALDPNDIVTKGRDDPPTRSGQLAVRTDVQHGFGAVLHAALMAS
jgi:hypothetical protein